MMKLLVKGFAPGRDTAGVFRWRRNAPSFDCPRNPAKNANLAKAASSIDVTLILGREVTIHGDFAFESCPIAKVYPPGNTRFRDGEAMFETLVVVGLIVVAIGFPWLMIHGLIQMWRDKSRTGIVSSGVAGTLSELDRVVRPSVEHVLEVKNSVKMPEDDIGGD